MMSFLAVGPLRLTPTNSNNVLHTAGPGCATIVVVLLRIFHDRRFVLIVLVYPAAVVERK